MFDISINQWIQKHFICIFNAMKKIAQKVIVIDSYNYLHNLHLEFKKVIMKVTYKVYL